MSHLYLNHPYICGQSGTAEDLYTIVLSRKAGAIRSTFASERSG